MDLLSNLVSLKLSLDPLSDLVYLQLSVRPCPTYSV